jgi:hypothetical protein
LTQQSFVDFEKYLSVSGRIKKYDAGILFHDTAGVNIKV